jgi:hypothetical protein
MYGIQTDNKEAALITWAAVIIGQVLAASIVCITVYLGSVI